MTEGELPPGWGVGYVNDLGEFINGCAFKPADWGDEGIPIVRIQNLTDPERPYNRTLRTVEDKYHLSFGDILVSWSATLDVFVWRGPHALVNQHIFKVEHSGDLHKGFVYFALKEAIAELVKSEHLHGTTMKHINRKPFLHHEVNIPPLNEQYRIVERIETLFAELEKGEDAIREVQTLLKQYRQSVLKAAVTGALTADWRAENADKFDHGRDLLARILKSRREQLASRCRYKEPVAPDTTDLPELSEGWVWASLDSLIVDGPTNGISPTESNGDEGTQSFKLTATTSGEFIINAETIKKVAFEPEPTSKYWLKKGDVLVQRGNTIEYVGTAAIFPGPDNQFIYPDLMMRLRFSDPAIAAWSVMWINFEYARKHFRRLATGTAGNMPKINGSTLKSLAVPIPGNREMIEVLRLVEDLEAKSTLLIQANEDALRRSAALRRSILKQAFAGKLVPQDPDDEPARELLARIRAERAGKPRTQRGRARA